MYYKQLLLIIAAYFAGDMLSRGLGLPVPANVLGLLILLALMILRWIALSDVEDTSDFIIKNLALIFVPSAVGIMQYAGLLRSSFWEIAIPWVLACIVGYMVTGWVTQAAIQAMERRKGDNEPGGSEKTKQKGVREV